MGENSNILLKQGAITAKKLPAAAGVLAALASLIDRADWPENEAAEHFRHEPALALALLLSAKRGGESLQIAPLVRQLGSRLTALTAFATPRVPVHLTALHQDLWRDSLRVAHLARQLAEKTHYVHSEAAWLAGLFHNLPEYAALADVSMPALDALDANGFLADAVRHCRAPLGRLKSAHPLIRLNQAATALGTRDKGFDHVDVRAALAGLGLDAGEGARLVQAANLYAQDALLRYGGDAATAGVPPRAHEALLDIYARHAMAAQLRYLFDEAGDGDAALKTLVQAMALALGANEIAVLQANLVAGVFEALPGLAPMPLGELSFRLDDAQSLLCRASEGAPTYWTAQRTDEFPVGDAQLARLLNAHTLLAIVIPGDPAHVMVAADPRADGPTDTCSAVLLSEWARSRPGKLSVPGSLTVPLEQVRHVVHEAANPLTIMRNYVSLLSNRLGNDISAQRDLKIISDEIERATAILRSLSPTAPPSRTGPQTESAEPVGINQTVSEIVRMALGTLFAPNRINVQIDFDPSIPPVPLNRDKLKQILLNLTKNAVEAMPHGGRLVFSTRLLVDDTGSRVAIHVQDSGPGLPEEVKKRLFEPQPSTKGGDHAGLGLSISRGLARALDGDIQCQSSSAGTVFTVLLPADGQLVQGRLVTPG